MGSRLAMKAKVQTNRGLTWTFFVALDSRTFLIREPNL